MQYRIILILILLSISRLAVSQNIDQQLDSLILIANNIQRTDIHDNRKLTDTDLKILAKYTNFKQLTLNKLGEIRDTNQVLKTYEYLAMINSNLNIHTQAVELYYKILKIYEKRNDLQNIIIVKQNIANEYLNIYKRKNILDTLDRAEELTMEVYENKDKIEDNYKKMELYLNISHILITKVIRNSKKSIEYLDRANFLCTKTLDIANEISAEKYKLYAMNGLLKIHNLRKEKKEAEEIIKYLSNNIHDDLLSSLILQQMKEYNKSTGNYKTALSQLEKSMKIDYQNYKLYGTNYYEKPDIKEIIHQDVQTAYRAKMLKERSTLDNRIQNNKNKCIICFILLLTTIIVSTWHIHEIDKQNKIEYKNNKYELEYLNGKIQMLEIKENDLSKQSIINEVELIKLRKLNKEAKFKINIATDYSRTIQMGMIPGKETMLKNFNGFVYWKPKYEASGDFYWAKEKNNLKYLLIGDCSGHSIIGNLLGMLCISILNEIFAQNIKPYTTAADILNMLQEKLSEKLHDPDYKSADRVEVALIIINSEQLMMQYSGSMRSILKVKNNEIMEYKPDYISITSNKKETNFTNQNIYLQPTDSIYLWTDGTTDQYGGLEGRQKFNIKRLKELITEIANYPVQLQSSIIKATLDNWTDIDLANGNENKKLKFTQLDDQTLIGIKLLEYH